MIFYIFHRHRVCLVDPVDLICSLYSWWEGLGSFSLATLPLSLICGFISTSTCGSSTAVCSWSCPRGLGFAPMRARCGGDTAAWVTEVLAAPGTQGSWRLGQQEIEGSRRVRQPVLANTLHYSYLNNPPPWQRSLEGHSLQGRRVRYYRSNPACTDARLSLPVAALSQWELSVKVAQLPGLRGPWWNQVCRDTGCRCRSYGPIQVFFQAFCSWWSEGLFGQSFSVAPPLQALRGLPCLGSFSTVSCIRHIEGGPWLGSYSVDLHIRHLKEHPGWGPTL